MYMTSQNPMIYLIILLALLIDCLFVYNFINLYRFIRAVRRVHDELLCELTINTMNIYAQTSEDDEEKYLFLLSELSQNIRDFYKKAIPELPPFLPSEYHLGKYIKSIREAASKVSNYNRIIFENKYTIFKSRDNARDVPDDLTDKVYAIYKAYRIIQNDNILTKMTERVKNGQYTVD